MLSILYQFGWMTKLKTDSETAIFVREPSLFDA